MDAALSFKEMLDNRPMNRLLSKKNIENQQVTNSMFTGGHNTATRAHSMEKVIDSGHTHPQMTGSKGSTCSIPGCNENLISDARGLDIVPCICGFKICRDCYVEELKNGDAICSGCKEPYKETQQDFDWKIEDGNLVNLQANSSNEVIKMDKKSSSRMEKELMSLVRMSQNVELDQNRWSIDQTYGYENAICPQDGGTLGDYNVDGGSEGLKLLNTSLKPLTHRVKIHAAVIILYRVLILVRIIVLGLFLQWRISHPNEDALWLWYMSIICELWFAFSWLLDQLPKLSPINRSTDLNALKQRFETPSPHNPTGKSDLPGVDIFVSTADPDKEPPLVTANTILSILATDYPVEKLSCYVSDDGGALLTFEAMAEAASFACLWVPFCRKHEIEPRNPESYFALKRDPFRNNKVKPDFVKDRRRVKREYDEFKVRINGLPDSIRRRSDAYNNMVEVRDLKRRRELVDQGSEESYSESLKIVKATWMADGTHWPGTWVVSSLEHSRSDHAGIIQVMLKPPSEEPLYGSPSDSDLTKLDLEGTDIRLPMLVYVSREKRPGYEHNKKAGAMNALVRASAIISNGPFILNLDCDHYVYNSKALRDGMCFMMDRINNGHRICFVQFPQRFEGIDPSDRYANHNNVFFDVNMRALDGLQGPVYVGTGCLFRRVALYGFDPPGCKMNKKIAAVSSDEHDSQGATMVDFSLFPKRFGNSAYLLKSIPVAEYEGRPLANYPDFEIGRAPGALTGPRQILDVAAVAEAVNVISCWYEDKTEWGDSVGWIYGSVTEDVVTGYRMHNRGWRSVYCVTKTDAFRGSAPINLTDRLHQVLRWATGSVEIFFSRNNALLAHPKMNFLQRIAYLNIAMYPFTSIFLITYCFLPALSLFSGQFIVQTLNVTFLVYLLLLTLTLCMLAVLEIKWSGIALEEWWRNEQFWLIGGTSAHLAAVLQGLLKVVAGIEISFTLTSKPSLDENDDDFAELYIIKWTSLMIPPLTIIFTNLIAIAIGFSRTIYSRIPEWSRLLGGVFFSFWVLAHLYPFAKGLMGRRGRTPTIVFVWSGLIAITISLLWVAIRPPSRNTGFGGSFLFL